MTLVLFSAQQVLIQSRFCCRSVNDFHFYGLFMKFVRYKFEVFVAVIFTLAISKGILINFCQVIFSNRIFQNYFLTSVFFFSHDFVAKCVFCIVSAAKLRFASVSKRLATQIHSLNALNSNY